MRYSSIYFFVFFLLLMMAGCRKEEYPVPSISLLPGEYTQNGDTIAQNGLLKFHLTADGHGAKLTSVTVYTHSGKKVISEYEKGIYQDKIDIVLSFYKKDMLDNKIEFTVMNEYRQISRLWCTISGTDIIHAGPIKSFTNLSVGMNQCSTTGQFADLHLGVVYTAEEIVSNPLLQATIDMANYYYATQTVPPTFSSPGAQDVPAYYPAVSIWNSKNITLYDYSYENSDITLAFDTATTDYTLLQLFTTGHEKCKFVKAGNVYPFKTARGKYGMIRVIATDATATGIITFDLKIQE